MTSNLKLLLQKNLTNLKYKENLMSTFQGQIHARDGWKSQKVTVSGVVTQSAAKNAMEARHPGAYITSVRLISNKDN